MVDNTRHGKSLTSWNRQTAEPTDIYWSGCPSFSYRSWSLPTWPVKPLCLSIWLQTIRKKQNTSSSLSWFISLSYIPSICRIFVHGILATINSGSWLKNVNDRSFLDPTFRCFPTCIAARCSRFLDAHAPRTQPGDSFLFGGQILFWIQHGNSLNHYGWW